MEPPQTSMEVSTDLHGASIEAPPTSMEVSTDLHGASMELRGGLHGVPDNVGRRQGQYAECVNQQQLSVDVLNVLVYQSHLLIVGVIGAINSSTSSAIF